MSPAIETERNARRDNTTRMMRRSTAPPSHSHPAVDAQDLPGDVGGFVRGEEPDRRCDLLRRSKAPEGDSPLHRPDDLRPLLPPEVLREKRRVRRARGYADEPDFVSCDLARERLGERDHPPLGGGEDRLAPASDAPPTRSPLHASPPRAPPEQPPS